MPSRHRRHNHNGSNDVDDCYFDRNGHLFPLGWKMPPHDYVASHAATGLNVVITTFEDSETTSETAVQGLTRPKLPESA